MLRTLVLAALARAATSATIFTCSFADFVLNVGSTPSTPPFFPYTVSSASTGAAWLSGGSYAFSYNGSFLVAGQGLTPGQSSSGTATDAALGPFAYLSVPWANADGSFTVVTNFTCYTGLQLAGMTASYPYGAAAVATVPAQAPNANGLDSGNARPSQHFPSFSASSDTALRGSEMGFINWCGEMDTYCNSHGTGLAGYGGGQQSGPLLLFNRSQLQQGVSKPQALVLGPGHGPNTHIAHQILGVVADPAVQTVGRRAAGKAGACAHVAATATGSASAAASASGAPIQPSCFSAPHTDEVGANDSPGTYGGIVVAQNNASACCEACAALGDLCDSWVYDTNGFAGGSNCWPLLGIQGSKQADERVLGIMWPVTCNGQAGTDAVGGVPSQGFETGLFSGGADACCLLCETLGTAACAGWSYQPSASNATADCFPWQSYTGTAPSATRTFGASEGRPMVLAAGTQGYITDLPPHFASTWWLSGSPAGINDAVYHYGDALRRAAGLQRLPRDSDPLRNQISYWSDNGALYYDGYWPLFFNNVTNTAEDVFLALKAYHTSLGLAVGTYQMDPWWYGGACGANGPPPPACFNSEAWPWATNWSAAPGFFPHGLASLDMPLTLYANLWAKPEYNAMTQFDWVLSTVCTNTSASQCGEGTPGWAKVVSSQSYDFHSYLFDVGAGYGQNAWEFDFSDYFFLGFGTDLSVDIRSFDEYFRGIDAAAVEHGFPVQLCMGLPSITLASVQWPSVTNARLQGDGYPGSGRYDIFQTALLYGAVQLAPFLDQFWSTSCQPALDNPYGNSTCEGDVEGLAAIATLSTGPVGFSDLVGFTNASLLALTSRSDSVILAPSLPLVNVEFFFGAGLPAAAGGGARIASAPSYISTAGSSGYDSSSQAAYAYPHPQTATQAYMWLSVFATFVAADVTVAPVDLWPLLPLTEPSINGYYVSQLSHSASCVDGRGPQVTGCAYEFGGSAVSPLLTANTGGSWHELYTVSPIFSLNASSSSGSSGSGGSGSYAVGWSLLGELGKFVRVSPYRVVSVEPGCASLAPQPAGAGPSLCVALTGAAGETVKRFALVDPTATVRLVDVALGAAGRAVLVCTCSSSSSASACACSSSSTQGAAGADGTE